MSSDFRKNLKLYVHSSGLSAAAISRKTGVPKQTISDWLAGTRPRHMEDVKLVADLLGVSILTLFFGSENIKPDKSPGKTPEKTPEKADDSLIGWQGLQRASPTEVRTFLDMFEEPHECSEAGTEMFDERLIALRAGSFFFDHARDLMQIRGLTGFPVELSDSWETQLGYPLEELKRKKWLHWIYPEDQPATVKAIEAFLLGERPVGKVSHRLVHKSGRLIPVNTVLFIDTESRMLFTLSHLPESK